MTVAPEEEEEDRFAPLKELVTEFIEERDWNRFHRPKDIAIALSIEAGELMELYLWDRVPDREQLEDELADVLFFLLDMSVREKVDLEKVLKRKIEKNGRKYPVDKVKGKDHKYTRYS